MTAAAHAFFDESGTHQGAPVLCVAGYVIEESRLEEFNAKWAQALADKGLSHFHMVDCAHGSGEFATLSKSARVEVQTQLIGIIRDTTARGVGAMMVTSVYDELMPFHPNMGSSYNYCIWHCLEGVRLWIKERDCPVNVKYHFEGGHASDGEADRIMRMAFSDAAARSPFGYSSHTFVNKRSEPGVQAADLLAWQMYTDWRHGMERRPRRKDFAVLVSDKKHRVCVVDAKRILYHVERMKEQRAWGGIEDAGTGLRGPDA